MAAKISEAVVFVVALVVEGAFAKRGRDRHRDLLLRQIAGHAP